MTGRTNSSAAAIDLSAIQMDGASRSTQLRHTLNEDTVDEYAEAMDRGDRFPLVDLVDAGDGTFLIADGWHRVSARKQLGKVVIEAIVHSVPEGTKPGDAAIKLALRANKTHGLHLTRGDKQKKAQAALLHPDYQGWSLRTLEAEIGVGKSTLARVRTQLIREGALAHPTLGTKMPEWMPDDHASTYTLGGTFADDEEMDDVYRYIQQLVPQGNPKDWGWDPESQTVIHSGLIADEKIAFSICDNPIVGGIPKRYEEVVEDGHNDGEENPTDDRWKDLTDAERDRIAAAQARREFQKAASRIKGRGDRELSRAINTLIKRAEEPGLWPDIRILVDNGGAAAEHREEDF